MTKLRLGSLFSGYGGLDLAIEEVFDAETTWVSDIEPGPRKILAHRFPDAPNLGDITTVDWSTVAPVDIIAGGSPCQDISSAGRMAGMREGTRSNLWVEMRDAIATLRPSLVVWENVSAAASTAAHSDLEPCPGCLGSAGYQGPVLRALGRVLGDLAELGYDACWYGLRAADVGACHGRFRYFVLASDANLQRGGERWESAPGQAESRRPLSIDSGRSGAPVGLLPTVKSTNNENRQSLDRYGMNLGQALGVTALLPTPIASEGSKPSNTMGVERRRSTGEVFLTNVIVTQFGHDPSEKPIRTHGTWGKYASAVTRQSRALGRPAPSPTELSAKGNPRLSGRFTEWMMGAPEGWICDVPGITRNEVLKACGNGVYTPQAAYALRAMAERLNAVRTP